MVVRTGSPFVPLLITVFESILEVFLLCLAGYIMAAKGILDKKTQKQINKLNVSLFTPSLLFSKVAFFLSPSKLRELWVIPIFFVIVTSLSMMTAWGLGTLFRLKKSQRSFGMAAAMFMNSNSLPIALMQSLVVTVPGLKWGQDDNKNAMVGRALTYLVLYSTLGMVLRWSYGVRLLAQADDEVAPEAARDEDQLIEPSETSPLLVQSPRQSIYGHSNGYFDSSIPASVASTQGNSHNESRVDLTPNIKVTSPRPKAPKRQTTYFRSFPNTPNASRLNLAESASDISTSRTTPDISGDEGDALAGLPRNANKSQSTRSQRFRKHASRYWVMFNEFMTMPLWAALLSLIVACIQPLQHALDEHLQPIKGALTQAGNCSIPVTLVVLGAYFYKAPEPLPDGIATTDLPKSESTFSVSGLKKLFRRDETKTNPKESGPRGETKTVWIAVVSRMIITPLLLLPMIALSTRFNFQEVFDDPVFVVSNVLLISSPPALTLAQITQAASGDAFERLISRTIFWSYCIVTPPATIVYVIVGMILAKL